MGSGLKFQACCGSLPVTSDLALMNRYLTMHNTLSRETRVDNATNRDIKACKATT